MISENIITTALLGISKKNLSKTELPEPIQEYIQENSVSLEDFFLQATAMSVFYHRAGILPQKLTFIPDQSIINETLTETPLELVEIYNMIRSFDYKGSKKELNLWLDLVIAKNQIVPASNLLNLITFGNGMDNETKKKILQVIGERGKWILSLSDEYSYPLQNENPSQKWEEGSLEERTKIIEFIVNKDVKEAIILLKSEWETLSINEKYAFLKVLSSQKNSVVLEFFDKLFTSEFVYSEKEKKKQKECRHLLAMALLENSSSEICQKTIKNIQKYFKSEKKKGLLNLLSSSEKGTLELPETTDDFFNSQTMNQLYALEPKYDIANFHTEIQYWFAMLIAHLPLQPLLNELKCNENEFVTALLDKNEFQIKEKKSHRMVFFDALVQNATIFKDETLALILLEKERNSLNFNLMQLLTVANFEKIVTKNNQFNDFALMEWYSMPKGETWTKHFTDKILEMAYQSTVSSSYARSYFGLYIVDKIHTDSLQTLESLNTKAKDHPFYKQWNTHIYEPIIRINQIKRIIKHHT